MPFEVIFKCDGVKEPDEVSPEMIACFTILDDEMSRGCRAKSKLLLNLFDLYG